MKRNEGVNIALIFFLERRENINYNLLEQSNIKSMIYDYKGIQVMFDCDLANLYNVDTKRINEAVKNNPIKFPDRYLFRITEEESISLKSKISTSKGGSRKGHTLFTEQGVYMLATILKSEFASRITLEIMDTFVEIRHFFSNTNILMNHENRLLRLESVFDNSKVNTNINKIFFNGQIYDSFSVLLEIFNKSINEIIIIDNYASKDLFDILREVRKKIIVVSKNINNTLIEKYKDQYKNITFIYNDSFHDRFIVIDRKIVYSCGASFKDLGKKCFAINEFNDEDYLNKILSIINV